MDMTMKDLKIHTLRGDIQQIGVETASTKYGIGNFLKKRYVNTEADGGLTQNEFDDILDEEYAKVEAWRKSC